MAAIDRYQDNLNTPRHLNRLPLGAGSASTANLGILSQIDPQRIQTDIRRVIPTGNQGDS